MISYLHFFIIFFGTFRLNRRGRTLLMGNFNSFSCSGKKTHGKKQLFPVWRETDLKKEIGK